MHGGTNGCSLTNYAEYKMSNNSVVLERDKVTREEWAHIMKSVKQVGEPGFLFVESTEHAFNPCVS